jgi:hypothetical protein
MTTILEVTGLKKYFPIRKGLFSRTVGYVRAVDGITFSVQEGEVLGLVGDDRPLHLETDRADRGECQVRRPGDYGPAVR